MEAPALEVGTRLGGLLGFPQVARVELGHLAKQLVETVALPPALGVARVSRLVRQLHAVAVAELLDRVTELEPVLLLQEREGVTAHLAAEAVVELLAGVDGEGRRALVVKRAEAHEAPALAA